MTNARTTSAVVLALLACTVVALAPPASAEPPSVPADACPVVTVLPYWPYVAVNPECLDAPLGLP